MILQILHIGFIEADVKKNLLNEEVKMKRKKK